MDSTISVAAPPLIPSIGNLVLVKARVHLICDTRGRHECYLRVIEGTAKLYPQFWIQTADIVSLAPLLAPDG